MKSRLLTISLILFISLLALGAPADKAARIDEFVKSYAALGQFNGAILVSEGGQVVFKKGYGFANKEWQIPNAPDTRFRLGSVTKQFTAMLVLQLVEQGKLSLDARLADVLPYYRKDTGAKITIHHLLNHTSGLPNYTSQPGFIAKVARNPFGVEDFVKGYCSGDLEFEPGVKYSYSNSGYFVLGAVIEQVAGKPYAQVLKERILEPVGLTGTGYDDTATLLASRAAGYQPAGDGFVNAPYIDMSIPFAAGSLYSTVEDLYRWDQALYTNKLLGPELMRKMFTPGLGNYGYGWGIRQIPLGPDKATRTVISHAGGINGFSSLIRRVVEDRHMVAILDNATGEHGRLDALSNGILDILYGRTPPTPKPSIIGELKKYLREGGIDKALARFREIKASQPDAFEISEPALNIFGYQLLQAGQADSALALFLLVVEVYPNSSNAYDSLAEAYMTLGKKDEAVKNYAKSLELDPSNRNAIEQLNKLMK